MRTCAFSLSIFMSLLYKTRHERLVVTQGRDAHLSIFMSFCYTAINEELVVAQGHVPLAYVTHTGTRCGPVPSRFYLHVLATQNKNERLFFTQGRDAHLCLLAFIFMSLLHKTKMKDCYVLKDEMRTCAFSLSIFMSLLYKTRNETLVVAQGRDAHPCLLAFYLHVLLIQNPKRNTGSYSGTRCTPVPSRFLSSCPSFTQL